MEILVEEFETITFPIHMRKAFDKAIKTFASVGYIFDIKNIVEWDDKFYIDIDTTTSNAIALGIKIGYNLKAEEYVTKA